MHAVDGGAADGPLDAAASDERPVDPVLGNAHLRAVVPSGFTEGLRNGSASPIQRLRAGVRAPGLRVVF